MYFTGLSKIDNIIKFKLAFESLLCSFVHFEKEMDVLAGSCRNYDVQTQSHVITCH